MGVKAQPRIVHFRNIQPGAGRAQFVLPAAMIIIGIVSVQFGAGLADRLFGVWMSLEPAVAALIGLALLGQHLSVVEWLAICCVMVACAGAAGHQARGTPSVTQGGALP